MSDLQAIADRVEIEALRGEFTDAVMMRDFDRGASLFTQDGVVPMPHVIVELAGREEIRAGGERLQGLWEYFVQTTRPGTIQVEGDTASGRAYIQELGRALDGRSHLNYAIYHDRYQRTPAAGSSPSACMRQIPRHHTAGGLSAPRKRCLNRNTGQHPLPRRPECHQPFAFGCSSCSVPVPPGLHGPGRCGAGLPARRHLPHPPLNRWPASASGCPPARGRSSGRHGYHCGEPLAITPAALPTPAGVLASHRHHDYAGMAALAACADHAVPAYAAVEPHGEPER